MTQDAAQDWMVYVVRCADETWYTGIAKDLTARLADHNAGRGAKYTKGRLPVALIYSEPASDRSEASRREHAIKRMPKAQKQALVSGGRRA